MTLTFEIDLDIFPLDLHAKFRVRVCVCLAETVVTDTHTHGQTMSNQLHSSLTRGVMMIQYYYSVIQFIYLLLSFIK